MTTVLDRDQIWSAIDAQRLCVADLLDELTDEQWRHPSLCRGWTVRDVAAHLTLQQLSWGDAFTAMVRYRGNIDRGIHQAARDRATALTTRQIIAAIRATVGSRRHNPGVTYAAAAAVTRMWTMRFPPPFLATKTMKRFQVTATDTGWSAGTGPRVHGPISAIMLVSSGRLVALPELSGPGAADLAARLKRP